MMGRMCFGSTVWESARIIVVINGLQIQKQIPPAGGMGIKKIKLRVNKELKGITCTSLPDNATTPAQKTTL